MAKVKDEPFEVLEDKKILFAAMHTRGMKQTELADAVGIKQASMSGAMNRNRMGLDVFNKILDAMDYDVVIRDRRTGEVMWKVEKEDE